jgi:hypothetical protein
MLRGSAQTAREVIIRFGCDAEGAFQLLNEYVGARDFQ